MPPVSTTKQNKPEHKKMHEKKHDSNSNIGVFVSGSHSLTGVQECKLSWNWILWVMHTNNAQDEKTGPHTEMLLGPCWVQWMDPPKSALFTKSEN